MTKAERTRQYIIEQTAPLFNKKGFEATSLADLTDATGLTKGALYGNFSNKEDIATEAFRYAIEKVRRQVRAKLEGKVSAKAQLIALLDFYAAYVFKPPVDGGCPLLNAAVEADDHLLSMRRVVAKEIKQTVDFIKSLLETGVKNGEFRKDTDADRLAYVFFCMIEGAVMYARVERSQVPMDIVIKHCKFMLNQISNKS